MAADGFAVIRRVLLVLALMAALVLAAEWMLTRADRGQRSGGQRADAATIVGVHWSGPAPAPKTTIDRYYARPGKDIATMTAKDRANGIYPVVTVTLAPCRTGKEWARFAAGAYDAQIDKWAVQASGMGAFDLGFQHEPEHVKGRCGTAFDYIAAYRRLATKVEAVAPQVRWVYVATAWGYYTGAAQAHYPGDDVVDVIGADGYDTRPPKTNAEQVFGAAYSFAEAHGKPMAAPEFGATNRDPQRQLDWTRGVVEWASGRNVAYLIYWASSGGICQPTCIPEQPTRDYLATVT